MGRTAHPYERFSHSLSFALGICILKTYEIFKFLSLYLFAQVGDVDIKSVP